MVIEGFVVMVVKLTEGCSLRRRFRGLSRLRNTRGY